MNIHPITPDDHLWVTEFLGYNWGSPTVISRGHIHQADHLPGFIARHAGEPSGLITYYIQGNQCEIVTLDSSVEGIGIGTALVSAVEDAAQNAGCNRLWLVTTNDNTPALALYQKLSFRLAALHRDAVTEARKQKPGLPLYGIDSIPIRDEIELEIRLQ
ncbi:MAG: GNAT family N-acetyltransferase [Chloroflexi bacterium]|nr:GNAT family N-acetyltransferase [Chloroflexota bacterium]